LSKRAQHGGTPLVRRGISLFERARDAFDVLARLLERHAGLEAARHVQQKRATLVHPADHLRRQRLPVHHRRRPAVGPEQGVDAAEPVRRDAHDGEAHAVGGRSTADDVQVAAEPALPGVVGQHEYRRFSRRAVVLRPDHAPSCGADAEGTEVVAGDQLDEQLLGAFTHSDADGVREGVRREGSEGAVVIPVVLVVEIRDLQHVAERRGLVRVNRIDRSELADTLDRQRVEKECVDDGEDGRVHADAESKRDHGGRGKRR
jgi:hypothetical protein